MVEGLCNDIILKPRQINSDFSTKTMLQPTVWFIKPGGYQCSSRKQKAKLRFSDGIC